MTLAHNIMYLTHLYVIQCMNTEIQDVLCVLFTSQTTSVHIFFIKPVSPYLKCLFMSAATHSYVYYQLSANSFKH